MLLVFGRNSVEEALSQGLSISKIWFTKASSAKYIELEERARKQKIPVFKLDPRDLDRIIGKQDRNYNIAAELSSVRLFDIEELAKAQYHKVLFAVNIEDPHNLGALIRTAKAFAFDAVIVPNRNSATLSPTVVSASAGAALTLPIIRINSVQNCIDKLKKFSFWLYATEVRAEDTLDYRKVNYDDKTVLLMGNEHKGLGPNLRSKCDFWIHIPCEFESLNVSVAAGIICSEIYRSSHG